MQIIPNLFWFLVEYWKKNIYIYIYKFLVILYPLSMGIHWPIIFSQKLRCLKYYFFFLIGNFSRTLRLHFSFLNCSYFVTIFWRVLNIKIIFIDIHRNSPPFVSRNSLTNQFYQTIWGFWQLKKKNTISLSRDIHPGDSWPHVK